MLKTDISHTITRNLQLIDTLKSKILEMEKHNTEVSENID